MISFLSSSIVGEMFGYSTVILSCFCLFAFICNILAKQWTTYSYAPTGAANTLSRLRSCQPDAQNMTVCGAKLINGNACELLATEACDGLGNGSESVLHLRKTTVRREQPFLKATFNEWLEVVLEYIPVQFQPGSLVKLVVTPLTGWSSLWICLYDVLTPSDFETLSVMKYLVTILSNGTGKINTYRNETTPVRTYLPLVATPTNQTSEIGIVCGTESLQIFVNGIMCLQESHDIPPYNIVQLAIAQVGNNVILHSIEFDAAPIINDV